MIYLTAGFGYATQSAEWSSLQCSGNLEAFENSDAFRKSIQEACEKISQREQKLTF